MEQVLHFSGDERTLASFLQADDFPATRIGVTSPVFNHKGAIPAHYTGDGANVNPPLTIHQLPKRAKSLALMVECINAPINIWVHWLVWNIAPRSAIEENSVPGIQGLNDFQQFDYCGPCPSLAGSYMYRFKVYALNQMLDHTIIPRKRQVEETLANTILGKWDLIGVYSKYTKH